MKAGDLVELAARNLRESVLRNSLTTVGIAVGVASLVAMLSLGIGLQHLAASRLAKSGLFDSIYVTSGRRMQGPSGRREYRKGPPPPLDEAARQRMTKLAAVAEVYPDIRFPAELRLTSIAASSPAPASTSADPAKSASNAQQTNESPNGREYQLISGLPMSARQLETFDSMKGQYFSAPDASEIILQSDEAKTLTDKPEDLLGKEIFLRYAWRHPLKDTGAAASAASEFGAASELSVYAVTPKEAKLKVVGLVESKADAGIRGAGSAGAYVPVDLALTLEPMQMTQVRLAGDRDPLANNYAALIVRATRSSQVETIENQLKQEGYNTFSLLDATRNLRKFFAILDLFLGIFGSLALAVASLGIINTLVMSILERRREIGIMKAIGASDGDVQKLFFAEAGAMGVFGGALGVLLGWTIGRIINIGTRIYMQRQQQFTPDDVWLVPLWLVLGAVGFSLIVSLVAGLYPAARAARLDPVQALRYD
ncbi:MAG TPA: FtsX-like permease family protein [Terriglobales bacterium]|nr:FtsX-like permease family protein [Terriglobales bacterium]